MIQFSRYYRDAFNQDNPSEDLVVSNPWKEVLGVVDGDPAAYSPSNPPTVYPNGRTGGQMVGDCVCRAMRTSFSSLKGMLLRANDLVAKAHLKHNLNPNRDDVAGASFAFCKIDTHPWTAELILGGDCFACVCSPDEEQFQFYTGFNEDAHQAERERGERFAECLKEADGDLEKAWDLYFSFYTQDRIRCSNSVYATLNGGKNLISLWTRENIDVGSGDIIILGTDGVIPDFSIPDLAEQIYSAYISGGEDMIFDWRDELAGNSDLHINGHPEAALAVIKIV